MISKIKNYFKETTTELKNVSWSTRKELVGATTIVLASTAIISVFIGLVDLFLSTALNYVFRR